MRKRAFTLIELLVVIAIIAILAAILFPVFAQAKNSAKTSASVSNAKQISLGQIMYMADYDDTTVPVGVWNSADVDAYTAAGGWASWGLLTDPYQKNVQILQSPLANTGIRAGEIVRRAGTRYMEYGYNYTYLSPSYCCNWPVPITPISSTSVGNVANTVMLTERTSRAAQPAIYWYGAGVGWMNMGTSEAPDCYTVPTHWCTDGWGVGSFWDGLIASEKEGKRTGMVALRSADKSVAAFVDGHVKVLAPGALAAGTNWTRTTANSAIVRSSDALYPWDTTD